MNTVIERRGVEYSAEAAGALGALRAHVSRSPVDDGRGVRCALFVSNDSAADAHALAFAFFDAAVERQRTIVQTTIGPHSEFSTTVTLELTATGSSPELHVALSNGDTEFTLVVPRSHAEPALLAAPDAGTAPPPAAADSAVAGERAAHPRAGSAGPDTPPGTALVVQHEPPQALAEPPPRAPGGAPQTRRVAPPPPAQSPPIVPLVLLFAALATFAAYLIARPQVAELQVPPTAAAGAAVTMTYRTAGVGSADYVVLGPDGLPIGRGPLPIGQGSFSVSVPAAAAATAYLVQLRVANVLGASVAQDYIRVSAGAPAAAPSTPSPAPAPPSRRAAPMPPPQIRSLAVDRATLAGGETLTVYYDVGGADGSIVLLDPAAQITYGRQPISAAGRSTFVAPHVDATRLLTLLTTVKRGTAKVQSRIGVTVTPAASDDDAATGTGLAPAVDDAAANGRASAGSAAIVAPAHVRSGQPVWVDLHGVAGGDAEIVLLDNTGRELDRRDIPAGKRSVEFSAPEVSEPTRLVFEATVPQGVGSVTLVRAISVTP